MGRGAPLGRAGSGPLTAPLSPVQTTLPTPKEPDTLTSLAGRRVGPGIVNPPIAVPTSPNRLADLGPPSNGLARSLSGQGSGGLGGLGGLGLKNALAGQALEVPPLGAQSPVGSRLGAFTQAPSGNKIADAAEAVTGAGLGGRIFNPGEGSQWRPQSAGFQGQTEVSWLEIVDVVGGWESLPRIRTMCRASLFGYATMLLLLLSACKFGFRSISLTTMLNSLCLASSKPSPASPCSIKVCQLLDLSLSNSVRSPSLSPAR